MKYKIVNDKGKSIHEIHHTRESADHAAAVRSAKTGENWFAVAAGLTWQWSKCLGWYWGR